jgi:hypothetical protein
MPTLRVHHHFLRRWGEPRRGRLCSTASRAARPNRQILGSPSSNSIRTPAPTKGMAKNRRAHIEVPSWSSPTRSEPGRVPGCGHAAALLGIVGVRDRAAELAEERGRAGCHGDDASPVVGHAGNWDAHPLAARHHLAVLHGVHLPFPTHGAACAPKVPLPRTSRPAAIPGCRAFAICSCAAKDTPYVLHRTIFHDHTVVEVPIDGRLRAVIASTVRLWRRRAGTACRWRQRIEDGHRDLTHRKYCSRQNSSSSLPYAAADPMIMLTKEH